MRLTELQRQVAQGEYRVDSQAVAEAIVRRLLAWRKLDLPEHDRPEDQSP
jgi:Anti-sigma-28 factor, FlgM